ncbi:hypothetical protein [Gilliamella sp. CG22]|uniref:hypothetical protein n=1 Tax=Gilliamella sp. CG22 TaxID=3351504 RepID=UPI0039875E87
MMIAVATKILHTVEDRETLVRTIIQLSLAGNAAGVISLAIQILPGGTAIANPSTTEDLDNPGIRNLLWQYTCGVTAGMVEPLAINVDLKSMRKLSITDKIVLITRSSVDTSSDIAGVITQFFKT